jgi:transaldolase
VNPLRDLGPLGQSVWLDFISRAVLRDGELQRLVAEDGVSGVTSNPTIFQKAMASGTDYDEQLRGLLAASPRIETGELFETAALDDIRGAAAVLRPVFDRTDGADGFVSFEVPPVLANDTAGTVAAARRIWKILSLPNVMIKVPATPAGIPAIEELIAGGVNVNVTLMFSMEHYEQVAQAYIHGLERCVRPARVASVASFFVSRVDSVVDKALEQVGTPEALALRGRIAVANSQAVYQRFREVFYGAPFAALRARGCRVQRPLWASTSTKNPAYRDVLYVEELIGPDTVNTMPPETVVAFRDHGRPRTTVDENPSAAREALRQLRAVGIDLGAITAKLQVDGVASFAKSYDDLLAALDQKRRSL